MAKTRLTTARELTEAVPELLETLRSESDVGAALIGVGYLDALLAAALAVRFRPGKTSERLLGPTGPLGTFSARAALAYSLRLIDKAGFKDLNTLAELRNQFAHHHLARRFTDPEIVELMLRLQPPQGYFADDTPDSRRVNPRSFFDWAIAFNASRIGNALMPLWVHRAE